MSPKILEILIIQNGGKAAAVEETSPRHKWKMAEKTDVSSDQQLIKSFSLLLREADDMISD